MRLGMVEPGGSARANVVFSQALYFALLLDRGRAGKRGLDEVEDNEPCTDLIYHLTMTPAEMTGGAAPSVRSTRNVWSSLAGVTGKHKAYLRLDFAVFV